MEIEVSDVWRASSPAAKSQVKTPPVTYRQQ